MYSLYVVNVKDQELILLVPLGGYTNNVKKLGSLYFDYSQATEVYTKEI